MIKRYFHGFINPKVSTSYDSDIVVQKIIKTIQSCNTIEQLNNCRKWINWIYNVNDALDLNGAKLGVIHVLQQLLWLQKYKIENK